jgi:hypothetical protein
MADPKKAPCCGASASKLGLLIPANKDAFDPRVQIQCAACGATGPKGKDSFDAQARFDKQYEVKK